jgi:hypothetical protein
MNTEDGFLNWFERSDRGHNFLERMAHGLEDVDNPGRISWTGKRHGYGEACTYNTGWIEWFALIEDYTSCNITFQSDKLPALSGMISALQKLTGDVCLAGLWKSWFLQGLLWRLQRPAWDKRIIFPKKPQRAIPWRAPTWSFASVEGVVLYRLLENDPCMPVCAELLDCDVTPKGVNPLGEITKGFAKIRAPVSALFDIASQESSNGRECKVRLTNERLAEGRVYFDIDVYKCCGVVMITSDIGIAIIPVNIAESTYIRVGALLVHRVIKSKSKDCGREGLAPFHHDELLTASHYPNPTIITLL